MCHTPVQPETLQKGCDDWGTDGNFVVQNNQIKQYTSGYHASRIINFEWVTHGDGLHRMFPATSDVADGGNVLVTAYAVLCPNGEWSILVVNRDENNAHQIRVSFENSKSGEKGYFVGGVRRVTFGSEQYVWHANGMESHADPDLPPVSSVVNGGDGALFLLPKASINVLRGTINLSDNL